MIDYNRIEQWLTREVMACLSDSILPVADGTLVFGRYLLIKDRHGVKVVEQDDEKLCLSGMRSALSWCLADKHNDLSLALEIQRLDSTCVMLSRDIAVRQGLYDKSKDPVYRQRVELKLITKRSHLALLRQQLEKCINKAKYIQLRGFQNETARTRYA